MPLLARSRSLPCVLALPLLLAAESAHATYSLVVADVSARLLGSVGTSCTGSFAVSQISGIAPGFGAIHAQASINASGRDRGVMMLNSGTTAAQVISAITAPTFDLFAGSRQYGVVTLAGTSAGYTGSSNMAYAADRQATFGSYVSSFQGNILTGTAVLDQLAASLEEGSACDLPETLMRALEAGAENGQGDSRCTPNAIPADAGFLKVVDQVGVTLISLEVTSQGATGAVVALRTQFDAWRATHPCASPADDAAVTSALDAGGPIPAQPVDTAGPSQSGPLDGAVADGGVVDASAPARPGAAAEPRLRDAQVRDAQELDSDPLDGEVVRPGQAGCSLGAQRGTAGLASGLLLAVAGLLQRRRRQRTDGT